MTAALLVETGEFAPTRPSLDRRVVRPAHRRNGWSMVPMTVGTSPAPAAAPVQEIPVYSLALEHPAPPRGELRWLGRLICFATALVSAGVLVVLAV
jgi:hypothetical protein